MQATRKEPVAEQQRIAPAATAWTFSGQPSSPGLPSETVTLVEGAAFCISRSNGDIELGPAHGLFFRDTRLLSGWQLFIDGVPPELLTHTLGEPFAATFISRAGPQDGRADSTVLLTRSRYVGHGMREDVVVRNLGSSPLTCSLVIAASTDFADLFEVKEHRVRAHGHHSIVADGSSLHLVRRWRGTTREIRVHAAGWTAHTSGSLSIDVIVPPRSQWHGCIQVQPVVDGIVGAADYPNDEPVEHAEPARRLEQWRQDSPAVETDDLSFNSLIAQTQRDLGALRIFDPQHPDRVAVAAGAPWFMTVFGRDSLLTAWMALPMDQTLALGTLRTLAALQGRAIDADTDEEPGRIMHEIRHGMDSNRRGQTDTVYYGSIDATPLFVMLLAELHRWGVAAAELDGLRPTADRAIEWIEQYGDRDGDGFVEYQRRSDHGLLNQGWKDSFDGVSFADGSFPEAPIALAEVQGYVYAAYLAHGEIAALAGDEATAARSRAHAHDLRAAFNRDFWLADKGYFAVALDGQKRPVDSLASNIGHCLWTGIVDDDKAARVAAALMSPDMFTGWGVRTLAASMGAYNPTSYHNGSVWPHDNAIAAAGLMRYGYVAEAQQIARGLLDASVAFDGRLPELFCGFDRSEFAVPIQYPTSCSPQAWAAASPLLLLRSLLRFDPCVSHGQLWLAPVLPRELQSLRLAHLPLGGQRISLAVRAGGHCSDVELTGLSPLALMREPRPTHFDDPSAQQPASQ
jgi:glycogen debranching enzyme